MNLLWLVLLGCVVAGGLGQWARHREQVTDRRAQVVREREAMYQALLWYADRSHWQRQHPYGGRHWRKPAALDDGGARARRALYDWERTGLCEHTMGSPGKTA